MRRGPSDVVSLRRLRWAARAPRVAAIAACIVLSLLGLRTLLGPASTRATPPPKAPGLDVSAAAFGEAFARAYFTFDPDAPERRERAVASFMPGRELPVDELPDRAGRVVWSTVAATEPAGRRRLIVTVALETTDGLRHLAVTVVRDDRGRLFIAAPPALIGPPPVAAEAETAIEEEVDDPALRALAGRVSRNYLARERDDLAADLDAGAIVSLPPIALRVTSVDAVTRAAAAKVAVTVTATGADGLRLSLRYELAVVRRSGRWLVRTVHVNPPATEAAR